MKSAWLTVLSIFALCGAAVGIVTPQPLCADSWAMPGTEAYLSPNGEYRFTVEPSQIGSQLEYFAQEAEAQSNGEAIERPAPIGLLEKRGRDGKWEAVWVSRLLNHVAPVDVLVADNGRHVVTFDNWHSVGHGENVIVIYGPEGELVRSMALTDLVPSEYKDALPHSVSSLRWKKDAELDVSTAELVIDVLVPGTDWAADEAETIEFRVALSDGAISKPTGDTWDAALCAADEVNDAREKAEQERLAYLRNPLVTPAGCDMGDWHQYLREAHMRLTPENPFSDSTSTTILFPKDHPRHLESVGWLRDRMDDAWGYPRNEAFASPCDPQALIDAVSRIVAENPAKAWPDATFYVSVPEAQLAQLKSLIAPTGAKLVWLDPRAAIPQRPERTPGSKARQDAIDASVEQSLGEMSEMMDALEGL